MSKKTIQTIVQPTAPSDQSLKLLQKYSGIVKQDPQDNEKFICLSCAKKGNHVSNKWVSLEGHLKSQIHTRPNPNQEATNPKIMEDPDTKMLLEDSDYKRDEKSLSFQIAQFMLNNALPTSLVDELL